MGGPTGLLIWKSTTHSPQKVPRNCFVTRPTTGIPTLCVLVTPPTGLILTPLQETEEEGGVGGGAEGRPCVSPAQDTPL